MSDNGRRLRRGINQLSVYILDEQQGPFEITVSAIDATS